MTDRELRKLRRADLLEMLLKESRENEQLRAQLEQVREQLDSRKIELQNAGSITQAAQRLNDIFQAAEQEANRYLENMGRTPEEESH